MGIKDLRKLLLSLGQQYVRETWHHEERTQHFYSMFMVTDFKQFDYEAIDLFGNFSFLEFVI